MTRLIFLLAAGSIVAGSLIDAAPLQLPKTTVTIEGGQFFINGRPTYAGWGFFDFRMKDEGFHQGYQSVPADWTISSPRKAGFFRLLAEITGHTHSPGPRD